MSSSSRSTRRGRSSSSQEGGGALSSWLKEQQQQVVFTYERCIDEDHNGCPGRWETSLLGLVFECHCPCHKSSRRRRHDGTSRTGANRLLS
jgi:hypothetical protein